MTRLTFGLAAAIAILGALDDAHHLRGWTVSMTRATASSPGRGCILREVMSTAPDLSYVTGMAVDRAGNVYVADRFAHGIFVIDPAGRRLRTLGRAGEGPGEFRFPRRVEVLGGDSIAVYDIDLGRLTVFAPASTDVAYTTPLVGSAGVPSDVLLLPDRREVIGVYAAAYRAADFGQDDYTPRQLVRHLGWDGSLIRDSILVLDARQSLVARHRGQVAIGTFPFGRVGILALSRAHARLYYGSGDSLAVSVYTLAGERVDGFSLPHDPLPLTAGDIADAGEGMSATLRAELREVAPTHWPAFRQLLVDPDGNIWVGMSAPESAPREWRLYTPQGDLLCTTAIPEDVDLFVIGVERAYGIRRDALDVPSVVAYEIGSLGPQPPAAGSREGRARIGKGAAGDRGPERETSSRLRWRLVR